jgi:hypothetical protein
LNAISGWLSSLTFALVLPKRDVIPSTKGFRDAPQITTGPVEKVHFVLAASFTKPGKNTIPQSLC